MIKSIIVLICIFNLIMLYGKYRLVSSTMVWILCYLMIFVLFPLASDKTYQHEGTIDMLALIGVSIFTVGSILGKNLTIKNRMPKEKTPLSLPTYKSSFICFLVLFAFSLITIINNIGTNGIISILQGRMTSKQYALSNDAGFSFVYSMHLLVPFVITIWIKAKTKKQKIARLIPLLLYITETILFGFTRIFLITILGIIFFYEMRNVNNKKQAICSIIGVLFVIVAMVFMNFTRSLGLNNYRNIDNYLNMGYVLESTDFGASYMWFDKQLNYDDFRVSPIVYLKPFLSIIPRSIWPDKPEQLSMQVLKKINPTLAESGYSTAGNSILGEGLAIAGYAGMFVSCFIWGILCSSLDKRYQKRINITKYDIRFIDVCYYIFSVFIILSAQRGDWSQYMTIVLWCYFLPLYLIGKAQNYIITKRYQNGR